MVSLVAWWLKGLKLNCLQATELSDLVRSERAYLLDGQKTLKTFAMLSVTLQCGEALDMIRCTTLLHINVSNVHLSHIMIMRPKSHLSVPAMVV